MEQNIITLSKHVVRLPVFWGASSGYFVGGCSVRGYDVEPLLTIIQLYCGDQSMEKTTDLSQVTDKLYRIMM
jgi:hypothetical protein